MIRLGDVSVALGGVDVLDSVSLAVDRGEFVGLVGPNGAGKTTLLRTVLGDLAPDAGAVLIDGDDVTDLSSRAASRRVAAVPQDTSVGFAFDVADVVAMGRTPYRSRFSRDPDAADSVDRALERTDTEHLRDRRVDTLSGGERQRVFVARALAQDAPALVLDEPTASLDVNHAANVVGLVADLAADDRAVLAAIHDLEAAARYCDRLALLQDGAVVDAGPPAEVLTDDALASTFDVAAAVTENPVTGSPAVTALPEPASDDRTRRVHVLGGGSVAARVVATCYAAGHDATLGPVPESARAAAVADSLDVPAVTVPPFAGVDAATLDAATERVAAADATVIADPAIDPAGVVLDVADVADRPVVLDERPLEARNAAGDRGRRRYEHLRERATAATVERVLDAVDDAADGIAAAGD